MRILVGDILQSKAQTLINTVNCVGVMGKGIALEFKTRFPDMYEDYVKRCEHGEVKLGVPYLYKTLYPPQIINFPTKRHWRGRSRIEDIESGLGALVKEIRSRGIRSVALPPLGSGLGGLNWADVRARIERAMADLLEVRVVVFEPAGEPALPKSMRRGKVPKMTPGRAALVGLMERYLAGMLDPFVSLLEVHKLMYFMQEAGEPLRLRFAKGLYGPYAENLRHVLSEIDGYYLSGYGAGGDREVAWAGVTAALHAPPAVPAEQHPADDVLLYQRAQLDVRRHLQDHRQRDVQVLRAVDDARRTLAERPRTRQRFERVAELVEGFESPFGLELLSTAHWLATREQPASENELIQQFYGWAERKRRFSANQVRLAANVLKEKGWIPEQPMR